MNGMYQSNPFSTVPQQSQQQQQSISPLQGLQIYNQFAGGEGLGGMMGGGSSAAGGASGAGGSAGGSAGSMMSSAGPWAALAAVIMANEYNADEFRQDDPVKYAQDIFGGKVLEQDFQKRWLPMMFGDDLKHDETGLGGDMAVGADLATLDFGNALEGLKEGTLGKVLGGIGDLF